MWPAFRTFDSSFSSTLILALVSVVLVGATNAVYLSTGVGAEVSTALVIHLLLLLFTSVVGLIHCTRPVVETAADSLPLSGLLLVKFVLVDVLVALGMVANRMFAFTIEPGLTSVQSIVLGEP